MSGWKHDAAATAGADDDDEDECFDSTECGAQTFRCVAENNVIFFSFSLGRSSLTFHVIHLTCERMDFELEKSSLNFVIWWF